MTAWKQWIGDVCVMIVGLKGLMRSHAASQHRYQARIQPKSVGNCQHINHLRLDSLERRIMDSMERSSPYFVADYGRIPHA